MNVQLFYRGKLIENLIWKAQTSSAGTRNIGLHILTDIDLYMSARMINVCNRSGNVSQLRSYLGFYVLRSE